jgi:hypothetical protein
MADKCNEIVLQEILSKHSKHEYKW